jgi:CCR4-NOT transcription complex subunit 1
MQELFGKMYHEELSLREMLELMRKYKSSREPEEQDLFACMVHGLVDEYHCYHEYPLEALTKTAVMFGGIINFRLVDGITLKVGLGMILEAVREHEVHNPMYKFGVEAIEQLIGRLPEWVGFCHLLLQIPSLAGTPIFQKAEEVLGEQGGSHENGNKFEDLGGPLLTNGNVEDVVVKTSKRSCRTCVKCCGISTTSGLLLIWSKSVPSCSPTSNNYTWIFSTASTTEFSGPRF